MGAYRDLAACRRELRCGMDAPGLLLLWKRRVYTAFQTFRLTLASKGEVLIFHATLKKQRR